MTIHNFFSHHQVTRHFNKSEEQTAETGEKLQRGKPTVGRGLQENH